MDMIFGSGIDALGCVLDAGEELGIVQRKVGCLGFVELQR